MKRTVIEEPEGQAMTVAELRLFLSRVTNPAAVPKVRIRFGGGISKITVEDAGEPLDAFTQDKRRFP